MISEKIGKEYAAFTPINPNNSNPKRVKVPFITPLNTLLLDPFHLGFLCIQFPKFPNCPM